MKGARGEVTNGGDPAMSEKLVAPASLDPDSMYHGIYDE